MVSIFILIVATVLVVFLIEENKKLKDTIKKDEENARRENLK